MAVSHQGIVRVSDGNNSKPQIMRMQLRSEILVFQKEELVYASSTTPIDSKERHVTVYRRKVGGLGLSVKGGSEHKLPILISRIFKDQAADQTNELYVGDAIIKVDDINVENCSHDEAVKILNAAGESVELTVRHHLAATPFLAHSLQKNTPPEQKPLHQSKKKKNASSNQIPFSKRALPKVEKRWSDVITIPLLMAYVTRYIAGTDKLRPFAFEIRNHDNKFMAIVECDECVSAEDWTNLISHTISEINSTQIKALNNILPPMNTVSFMTWVEEAKLQKRHPWCSWHPRFFALKGLDVCVFESPPVTVRDWMKSGDATFNIYQTMMKVLKESEYQDERMNCFLLQTCDGVNHYLSVENQTEFEQLEMAWQRATYTAITKLGSKTFPALVNDETAALTLDWNMGFALYDTAAKRYVWKYRFSQLKGSSDDGKTRLKLHFQNLDTKEIEIKELETPALTHLLFCIHSFLTAKVVSVDPNFLHNA